MTFRCFSMFNRKRKNVLMIEWQNLRFPQAKHMSQVLTKRAMEDPDATRSIKMKRMKYLRTFNLVCSLLSIAGVTAHSCSSDCHHKDLFYKKLLELIEHVIIKCASEFESGKISTASPVYVMADCVVGIT
ncbi:hypothetical protein Drorol1_Dr00011454 [Drosera rotundifolia]